LLLAQVHQLEHNTCELKRDLDDARVNGGGGGGGNTQMAVLKTSMRMKSRRAVEEPESDSPKMSLHHAPNAVKYNVVKHNSVSATCNVSCTVWWLVNQQ